MPVRECRDMTENAIDPELYNVGEFWTSRQRQGHSLHEISYRACFKPQIPEYFISRFTEHGDVVCDPFLGRGTTLIQAHIMKRVGVGSDINPLCAMLARPRFSPPTIEDIKNRLADIMCEYSEQGSTEITSEQDDFLAFYHPKTLSALLNLREWFRKRTESGDFDATDDWIRMVCLNRLTGHSSGFFSVRTMPPNQAVSADSQRRINERNRQKPEHKDVSDIIVKKTRSLLRSGYPFDKNTVKPSLHTASAIDLYYLSESSVSLIVTSPPFLDVVDYKKDNWLRCWFANIDTDSFSDSRYSSVAEWSDFVKHVFVEMCRVVKAGGIIAFEVGEVKKGTIKLEEEVVSSVEGLPVELESVMVNLQNFSKTSNIWGIKNNVDGTNTNRVLVFKVK